MTLILHDLISFKQPVDLIHEKNIDVTNNIRDDNVFLHSLLFNIRINTSLKVC